MLVYVRDIYVLISFISSKSQHLSGSTMLLIQKEEFLDEIAFIHHVESRCLYFMPALLLYKILTV